ncbi:MAG: NAD(P)/FAD-dependent oxidoreductase [Clostridium sp.]|nr:NAD(P)/FAD-dependent oxidoreductase [Clostridium sp.]
MKKRVVVIGAGASGMTAAIFAARAGAETTLLEHKDRPGKKLLSTGNGKCNLSNRRLDDRCYRSGDPGFPMEVIQGFPLKRTLDFFEGLGIVIRDRDGYLYPRSGQASSVAEVLRRGIRDSGVRMETNCHVRGVRTFGGAAAGHFAVLTDSGTFEGDAVILACGSKAAPATGSDGSGYDLAESLGHTIIKPLPALVQLRCRENFYRQIAGIRIEAEVSLWSGGERLADDQGELQLTDYGISGIPVFQVSRFAARALDEKKPVTARIDFFPGMPEKRVRDMLCERAARRPEGAMEEFFTGWLPDKLSRFFLKYAGIRGERPAASLSKREFRALERVIRAFETEIAAVNSFEHAQVCCGGVDVREVSPRTMESQKRRGLYLAGELLDVDGICGGYNLQFAWSSGAVAGMHAGV